MIVVFVAGTCVNQNDLVAGSGEIEFDAVTPFV